MRQSAFAQDDCKTAAEVVARAKGARSRLWSLKPPPPSSPAPVVETASALPSRAPTPPSVVEVLPVINRISLTAVIDATCSYFGLPLEALISVARRKDIVFARHICIFAALETTQLSMKEIARRILRGDHTTVVHAREKIRRLLREEDANAMEAVNAIVGDLRSAFPGAAPAPDRTRENLPPSPERPNSGRSYSPNDLAHIIRRREEGATPRVIARELGRSPSAILDKLWRTKGARTVIAVCANTACAQQFQRHMASQRYCCRKCKEQMRTLRNKELK